MPGGRISYVVNAICEDPGMEGKENIIVMAGQNNINADTNQTMDMHTGLVPDWKN